MRLRLYRDGDLPALLELFYSTVHTVCAGDYTSAQLDAWAPRKPDEAAWDASLRSRTTLVAEEDGAILGFGNIGPDGYLDLLYVHKDHQRRGIAAVLCDFLETLYPVDRITVHASETARPFFEKQGYRMLRSQRVERRGQVLTNYVMEKELSFMDIIAAIATGHSPTAIGIVRVSGEGCFACCDRVFRAANGRPFSRQEPRKMVFGEMLDTEGRIIDRGLAVRFPGPHSYTGEDSAEFHCHGSPVVLRELLSALFAAGARQAGAGEFTKRAFLNGRLDLTQAEAVVDLIDAETASAARNAAAQLDGGLRRVLEPIQDALLDITSRFYAVVDYPDEDIEDIQPKQVAEALTSADRRLTALLATCQRGKVLKSGVRTAIVGRPNAGKSSLLNALAGYERAIVTDVPGTTRDTVEESVLCGGVLLRLIDTAGIRDTADVVEQMGVERSRKAIQAADLILVVIDISTIPTLESDETLRLARASGKPFLVVFSKLDLYHPPAYVKVPGTGGDPAGAVYLSAVTGEGLSVLEDTVAALFPAGDPKEAGSLLTDQRQEEAARRARDAVRRARQALESGLTPDAVLTDAEEALDALGELTGRTAREEIVSRIFSRFCVGK